MPGAEQVDAGVPPAAGALQIKGKAAEGARDRVLIMSANIGGGGRGEAGAAGVSQEGREVVV